MWDLKIHNEGTTKIQGQHKGELTHTMGLGLSGLRGGEGEGYTVYEYYSLTLLQVATKPKTNKYILHKSGLLLSCKVY